MQKSFHEACHETLLRRFAQSPILFERLPLELPQAERAQLHVSKETLEYAIEAGFTAITYNLPESFLRDIINISQRSDNSALEQYILDFILGNACIAHEGIYPLCQDTGTASVYSWRGNAIVTNSEKSDYAIFSEAIAKVWLRARLRNSQLNPVSSYGEVNTGNNLPLLLENFSVPGASWDFIVTAKGGGSSNKSTLIQATKSSLNPAGISAIFKDYLAMLGVSACPPYTVGIAIGGQSPEESMFAAKLASSEMLDLIGKPPEVPFRDHELEALFMNLAEASGWGAQFGGHRLVRKAVVLRLTRHAASLPISFAVSCTAHRWAQIHIDASGTYLERMADPACSMPPPHTASSACTFIRLPINDLSACRNITAGTLVKASGTVILARDAVHTRLMDLLAKEEPLPAWAYNYPVFYASPTETPEGCVIGSIGPTTSKRMDSYIKPFLEHSVFTVMIGKGERAPFVREACKAFGGVYFAAPGGCSAMLAKNHVTSMRIIDWPELGMEAVRLITIKDMPLLCVIDSTGKDFYTQIMQ